MRNGVNKLVILGMVSYLIFSNEINSILITIKLHLQISLFDYLIVHCQLGRKFDFF